eukprot:CAMPEP_0118938538 /NCGR_PEP_ID=MMETSP1169-20130426/26260_1 /TAXON_ID=36882 /ORGANISM="Pyramimonas obovata, Strain CCMP722" /LENGTH=226 /DNA_ID=CAMNT_0006882505 /DNA_START=215 /DNA_END=891 /DNA_ORIENTATION=-
MTNAHAYPPHGDDILTPLGKESTKSNSEYAALLQEIIETFKDHPEELKDLRRDVDMTRSTNNDMIYNLRNTLVLLTDRIHKLDNQSSSRLKTIVDEKRRALTQIGPFQAKVRAVCRVREYSASKTTQRSDIITKLSGSAIRVSRQGMLAQDFNVDKVYGDNAANAHIFQEVRPLVQSAMAGLDACVFAYGATGSGKSSTLQGRSDDPGLIERCFEDIFQEARLDGG